jgi:serine/threonine protein phosphatase PrpC
MQISVHQEIGNRRDQQDRFVVCRIGSAFALAVFDGHSGAATAEFGANLLPPLLGMLQREHGGDSARIVREAILKLVTDTEGELAGSSVSIAWVEPDEDRIAVGVLGDSPIVVSYPNGTFLIAPQHDIHLCPEDVTVIKDKIGEGGLGRASVERGYIWDPSGLYGVNLTRALGDAKFKDLLLREPFVESWPFEPEALLLLATDGVRYSPRGDPKVAWPKHDAAAEAIRHGGNASKVAKIAKDIAADANAYLDNITVITARNTPG